MHTAKIAIVTPTLGNLDSLYKLSKNLSYINEEIKLKWYIILKPEYSNKEQVIDLIEKKLNTDIDYEIHLQTKGGFSQALAEGLSVAKEDIIFQNDDDVIIPIESIKKVLNILEKNPQIGVVTGRVNGRSPISLKHTLLYTFNTFLSKTEIIKDYLITINDVGLCSVNLRKIYNIMYVLARNKGYFTLCPIGSSMALRKTHIKEFKIPEITKRSINNETFIALTYKKLGLDILYYPDFNVFTDTGRKTSLSRPKNKGLNVLEIYLLPIYVRESGYDINLTKLIRLKEYLQRSPNIFPYREYILKGLELSTNYLMGNLTIKRIYDIVEELSRGYS